MEKFRKLFLLVVIVSVLVLSVSCQILSSDLFFSFKSYYTDTDALDALISHAAVYSDLPVNDRWGLVWNGLFSTFTETNQEKPTVNKYYRALKAIGIQMETYYHRYTDPRTYQDSAGKTVTVKGYDTYSYRVGDRDSIIKLADLGMGMLYEQIDAQNEKVLAEWLESFATKLKTTTGSFNGFALSSYIEKVDAFAVSVFDYDKLNTALADNSFSARLAKTYLEQFPDGLFLEYARARTQKVTGSDATLIL